MSDVIYKYVLATPVTVLGLPADAEVLAVGVQNFLPVMWVRVDLAAPTVQRTFVGIPTGSTVSETARYVGTANGVDDGLVFHIHERVEVTP